MYDKKFVLEILRQIENSSIINEPDDFVKDEKGLEKLDSICMQLIAIGEALKQIDKITEGKLLLKYPQVEWEKAKKMRDVIAHHYFDIDEEVVFAICKKAFTFNVRRLLEE